MFLFAVTQTPAKGPEDLPVVCQYHDGLCHAAAWSSLEGLRSAVLPDGLRIRWGRLPSAHNELGGHSSQITLATSTRSLSIEGSSIYGLPLYYTVDSHGDFFCSTHISLLRSVGVAIEENQDVLPEFFVYRNVMPPFTMYKGLRRILYAGGVALRSDGCRWSVLDETLPTWLNNESQGTTGSFGDHLEDLTSRIRKSVQQTPGTSDEVAVLMSGGIDSSIIAELCRVELGVNDTFSTSYPFESQQQDMERPYAESAAEAMDFHHKHYISSLVDYTTGVLESIAMAEEPVHHLQTACLYDMFKNGLPQRKSVAVQGLGAGGAFGNFRNHLYMLDKPVYRGLGTSAVYPLLKAASRCSGRGHVLLSRLNDLRNKAPLDDPRNPIWCWHQYGDVGWVCEHFGTSPEAIISRQQSTMKKLSDHTLYHVWASYSLLGDEDITLSLWSKLAHTNSRVLHSPFYDEDVLARAFDIPWHMKLQRPENVVRKSVASHLGVPEFIVSRRKTGFGIKRSDWATEGSVFDPLASLAEKVMDPALIREMRVESPAKAMLFWNMINYALWKRICINGERLDSLRSELQEAAERALIHG